MPSKNRLQYEKSPYLLQHAQNPVDWYPWGEDAFKKAKNEDKPVFLSIGYSTCHWCHVMAHESFENDLIAAYLNANFVSIKVDREERPDIDSIYMRVCQAYTGGSGGWPTSIFMTCEQKPFFAGTYFTPDVFIELLKNISLIWRTDRTRLVTACEALISSIEEDDDESLSSALGDNEAKKLIKDAINALKLSYDKEHGGFGSAPKFPSTNYILLLISYYEATHDESALKMATKTLEQMYRGGLFDHIGFGFSRYSTDDYFLVPHFEKMLYDNALLIMSNVNAYRAAPNDIFKSIAVKTADFVLRELRSESGGFYSAQDADSEGIEGKYYVFNEYELARLFGDEIGKKLNRHFGITVNGNFEGKSIPNLLDSDIYDNSLDKYIPEIYEYRKSRTWLHTDDKILTAWNGLMITALAELYRATDAEVYLDAAKNAYSFIEKELTQNGKLMVSWRNGEGYGKGYLDDHAFILLALLSLYEAAFDESYLIAALSLCDRIYEQFADKNGGFYMYGKESEELILRPKETYDGAMPSGNSVMAYALVKLYYLTHDADIESKVKKQLDFMNTYAATYPTGYTFYLRALLLWSYPHTQIVCALKQGKQENLRDLSKKLFKLGMDTTARVILESDDEYPLLNDKDTFYICKGHTCLPPVNELNLEQ